MRMRTFPLRLAAAAALALGFEGAALAGASANYEVSSVLGGAIAPTPAASASYTVRPGARLDANLGRAGWSLQANPSTPFAGEPVTLRAFAASTAEGGRVAFTDNGQAIAGCGAVRLALLPRSRFGEAVATCEIPAIAAGTHEYAAAFTIAGDARALRATTRVDTAAGNARHYTDLWWGGLAQNGWGLSIVQHGGTQFNVLYAYDAAGTPVWYVMPGGSWDAARTTYSGALYAPRSAPFDAYDPSRFEVGVPMGQMAITYTGPGTATLAYTIAGVSGSKQITRQAFATEDGTPRLEVGDLWWGGMGQNGWGVNIAQQGRQLFVVWYSYDAKGRATWRFVPGGTWEGSVFSGTLYAAASSPFGEGYDGTALRTTPVGTMTIDFIDQAFATVTYTMGGVTQAKTVERQGF